ncbi:nucleotidyltransferase family protein [Flavobacteriaceae bacterium GSB9]|nr:nucleotidyltransferase family protein [Flavobacteriaceae bacterium GSB9]
MKKPSPNIAIVVLAAGASRRMEKVKQLLPWGDVTLVEHVIRTVLSVKANTSAVVLGANSDIVNPQLKEYPITIIKNERWKEGMSKSISKATLFFLDRKPRPDGIMFILADQPFVTSTYLSEMINSFTPNKKQILATRYKDGKKGVPVVFDKYYFKELADLKGDKGAKIVLEAHNVCVQILDAPFVNMDIDLKEDYEKAIETKNKKDKA